MKPKKASEINDLLAELLAELRAIREALARPASTWLSVEDAAAHARVSPDSIRRLLNSGGLTRHKIGDRILIDRTELDGAIRATATGGTGRRLAKR